MELNFFRFKQLDSSRVLLTNDSGHHITLSSTDFTALRENIDSIPKNLKTALMEKDFLITEENRDTAVRNFSSKNRFLKSGPGLHIIIVTLRCCHSCIYCHASRKSSTADGYDMDIETAEKTVDFILASPERDLIIEFQGGEPLLNLDIIRRIVSYTEKMKNGKRIIYSIVTNMNRMDEEAIDFFSEHDFRICTSLDGTEDIHNKNRPLPDGNSFRTTTEWIRKINDRNKERSGPGTLQKINALITVTANMFGRHREIIDTYLDLDLTTIFLRPINPFGFGKKRSDNTTYAPEAFLDFYRNSVDYLLEKNRAGARMSERNAKIILTKILNREDPNFLDLRSPCGAGIGQLAYTQDGSIFTCDEGRMVAEMGDDIFKIGDVRNSSYHEVINHETVRSMCVASCLEGIPECNDCVFHPYCGICPVYNYSEQGSLFGNMASNARCTILKGIHSYLFERLEENADIFHNWVNNG